MDTIIKWAIYAAIAAALIGAGVWYLEGRCNNACKKKDMQLQEALATIKAAAAAEAAVAQRMASAAAAQEAIDLANERKRNDRFTPVENKVRNLPAAVGGTHFPAAAASVLNAAVAAANADAAPATSQPHEEAPAAAADSDVASVTRWGLTVTKLYAACTDQVSEWQAFYDDLLHAQAAEQLH